MKAIKTLLAGLVLTVLFAGGAMAWDNTAEYLKRVAVDVKPTTTSTYDIGSATKRWDNIYVDNIYGPSDGMSIDGNLYPTVDNAYDLGSTALRWNDGYFGGNLTVDGTAYYTGASSVISGNTTISITPGISIGGTVNSGFGTSTPSAMLDVGGGTLSLIDGTNDLLVKGDLETDDSVYIGSGTITSLRETTTGNLYVGGDVEVDGTVYSPFKVSSNSNNIGDYFIVTSDGNIGIGTAVTGQRLRVELGGTAANNAVVFRNNVSNGTLTFTISSSPTAKIDTGASTVPLVLNSGTFGNVGIGTTIAPSATFVVARAATSFTKSSIVGPSDAGFAGSVEVDGNIYVDSSIYMTSATTRLFMKQSDGGCSRCGVDAAGTTWSCVDITCGPGM